MLVNNTDQHPARRTNDMVTNLEPRIDISNEGLIFRKFFLCLVQLVTLCLALRCKVCSFGLLEVSTLLTRLCDSHKEQLTICSCSESQTALYLAVS